MAKTRTLRVVLVIAVALAAGTWLYFFQFKTRADITVVISPYQDLAMLVNIERLGLEERYGTDVEILTIPWEETYPAVLSAAGDVDMAFSSFADYLAKYNNVNRDSADPLLFLFPAYIFKGGAFVSFKSDAIVLDKDTVRNAQRVNQFLDQKIALQMSTLYEMMIVHLASIARRDPRSIDIINVGFDTGYLAAVRGDVDIAAVGLTQFTEARKRGATIVLDMDQLGFADITGFIAKKSTVDAKGRHVRNLIRMWFDCVSFVFSDLEVNSSESLEYLETRAATQYTMDSYKAALEQEYFPLSLKEVKEEIILDVGKYSARRIYKIMSRFLTQDNSAEGVPPFPKFLEIY